jgi:phospholipid/cholesterol/gamma-HCH transport system permease protein
VLDTLKGPIQAVQDFFELAGRAIRNVLRKPHYVDDILLQMESIGVGSVPIVLLTGFFSGAVMAMQMGRGLQDYGQTGRTGQFVSIILVRELGPVLTGVMVAGRNASGIASELGSMQVTEQIDAMRALGTDPVQKLVTPRMIATALMLPCLTIVDDFIGMIGGGIMAKVLFSVPTRQYWTTVWRALVWSDVGQGLTKPFIFSFAVSLIGCYYGLRATGGTQGVGRATTQAVVWSSITIFVLDLFISKIFIAISQIGT